MTPSDHDRDPFVAAALRSVQPPPPRPGFWDELAARLEAAPPSAGTPVGLPTPTPAPAPAPAPARVLPLTSPPARRRWGRVAVAALSAAAVAAVAVGIAIRDDNSRDVRTTSPPSTAVAANPSVAQAEDAARRWLDACNRGDTDAAWDLLGPQSRDSIGGTKAALADLMRSALREGWGAWASATGLTVSTTPILDTIVERVSVEQVFVVTFTGVVTQEGSTGLASIALGVRIQDGGRTVVVEPFVYGPALGLIERIEGPVPATGPVGLNLDGPRPGYNVIVDGQAQPPSTIERSPSQDIVAWRPASPLAPGRHFITVAFVRDAGGIVIASQSFEVA